MKVDAVLHQKRLTAVSAEARNAEQGGFDAVWVTEEGTDPFLHAHATAAETSNCLVGTAIAVAFARSPMTTATSAWEVADSADGRFVLGLGSQVKAHIERRYSMPWGSPVEQMRDYLEALAAIWSCWRTGDRLDHRGTHYTHTLSAPFWAPAEHDHHIPVWLAAVGPRMLELAGELCDGVILHPFSNSAYEKTVVQPALARGLERAGRSWDGFEVARPLFMIMGDSDEELEQRRIAACQQIAFYGSTKSYRPVLDAVGLGAMQTELADLARDREWERMAGLIGDDVLRYFAVMGTPEQMPESAAEHVADIVTRVSSYSGWSVDDDRLRGILSRFGHSARFPQGVDRAAPSR